MRNNVHVFVQKKIINIYHNYNFYAYGIPVDCAFFFFFFFSTTEKIFFKKILIFKILKENFNLPWSHLPLTYALLEIDVKDV